jgi:hypothetical protein
LKIQKEERMKKFKSVWVFGICMALFLGPLGALDLSGQEYVWTNRAGIIPPAKIDDQAADSVKEWIGKANSRLVTIIGQLPDMNDSAIEDLIDKCKSDDTGHGFGKTYLKIPVLESESGAVYVGWEEVIWRLKEIADDFQQQGDVEIVSIPIMHGPKMKADFRAEVSTKLIFNPSTYLLRGCGIHRTSCTSDPC